MVIARVVHRHADFQAEDKWTVRTVEGIIACVDC